MISLSYSGNYILIKPSKLEEREALQHMTHAEDWEWFDGALMCWDMLAADIVRRCLHVFSARGTAERLRWSLAECKKIEAMLVELDTMKYRSINPARAAKLIPQHTSSCYWVIINGKFFLNSKATGDSCGWGQFEKATEFETEAHASLKVDQIRATYPMAYWKRIVRSTKNEKTESAPNKGNAANAVSRRRNT